MKRINSYDELKATVEKYKPLLDLRKKDGINVIPEKREILVCGDTGCASSGSIKVLEALQDEIKKANLEDSVKIQLTGCFGFCAIGPIIKVYPDNIFYVHLTEDDAKEISFGRFISINSQEPLVAAFLGDKVLAIMEKRGQVYKPRKVLSQ